MGIPSLQHPYADQRRRYRKPKGRSLLHDLMRGANVPKPMTTPKEPIGRCSHGLRTNVCYHVSD